MTDQPVDPSLLRGLTQARFTRRDLFRYAGVAGGALGLSSILAACGTKGVATGSAGASNLPNSGMGTDAWWDQQTLHNTLDFENWPYYMDIGANGGHPSLDEFTKKTGIKVNYTENIQDNPSYWNEHVRPQLSAGKSQGHDIIVLTNNDYPLGFLLNFGWAIPLDHRAMKNFDKYASKLVTDPSWDPGNTYTMAWQSGYTLIAYNTKYIKEDITTVQALFDPKYQGKIGMFGNASELGSIGLLAIGKDPATSTPDDWNAAAEKLKAQKPLVRSYYDQGYIKALKQEETWISMAWSGDIFQAGLQGYDTLKTVVAQEGVMIWTDNMLMPYTATNPKDAMTYMDYVYDPKVQAVIEDYNHYVCPVPASKDVIATALKDPKVAGSPLVFPDAEMVAVSKPYYQWKNSQDLTTWNDTFVPIYQ